ncbi:MAG: TonB-dependent receptor plug domain-containing protein [Balneolaceae bacterium]|nr:TonB-dependent receptor plug domain-containing protein [Balneolaceae bacterium]
MMNAFNRWTGVIGTFLLLAALGCATSGGGTRTGSSGSSGGTSVSVNNPSATLADYLRQVSGVTVQGSGSNARVFVRGAGSVTGYNQALFVIDGSRAGRSLSQIENMVNVNDIESIEVLKGNAASARYGLEGSNGVIMIRTKGN